MVITHSRIRANRQNALQSTGPKTTEGREVVKCNAISHGLRSVQTVVPGESPDEWDTHRNAVVADLNPQGIVEVALAEQVAAGLWRLGRVLRYESDMIAVGQDRDELANDHEKSRYRGNGTPLGKSGIPTRQDVDKAKETAKEAQAKVAELQTAMRQLEGLAAMEDEAAITDWTIYEPLKRDLRLGDSQTEKIFKGDEDFAVRHVRAMLKIHGTVDQVTAGILALWREQKLPKLEAAAASARKKAHTLGRRYESALDRLACGRGIPNETNLEKVTRYESHLWRIIHRALDRLREFQEMRGAVPTKGPSIAVAVVQTGGDKEMGLIGKNALDTSQSSGTETVTLG